MCFIDYMSEYYCKDTNIYLKLSFHKSNLVIFCYFCVVFSTHAMKTLQQLYCQYCGKEATQVRPLTPAGSNRRYYRLSADDFSAVGVVGTSAQENAAFLAMAIEAGLDAAIVNPLSEGLMSAYYAACALTGAVAELIMEIVFSPIGYRITKKWRADNVGKEYFDYIERTKEA